MPLYDFKAARQRIQELTALYRLSDDEMTRWALAAEVEEIEKEINEEHKKAAGQGDRNKNIILFPILS